MIRRNFIKAGLAAGVTVVGGAAMFRVRADAAEGKFPVRHSDAQWKKLLTADQYAVLRNEATERPFSSQLTENKQSGVYSCVGCDTPVFSSKAKFDSGTGWPSFFEPISATAVASKTDYTLIYPRTEVHCATCGGHLGHVFNDGPKPTGMRYCINGVVLDFTPGSPEAS
ncbi:peptide-methionine (R)-S-oxide reductase MsrB [Jiella sp. MQZ9-1]|uniref:peptide-methionine (R)-S-oxide reductase n=1 Tax=Jiella flava TaxID=2816857 RepID=A0A939FUA6_9HYPH|nr:peptide-methionine (R)-S-oxide reductase MsrB [Jiella flava]MBO0661677.1 peptide-methionine (R)-S-oxide reductase MsrB [Jiella flava]MCD2470319.1 peptide-methionine (R)-S-oxide reductase MsrB [Jiella flava]